MLSIRSAVFEEARRFSQHERPILSPFNTLFSAKLSNIPSAHQSNHDTVTEGNSSYRSVWSSDEMVRSSAPRTSRNQHMDATHVSGETHWQENGPTSNLVLTRLEEDEPPAKKSKTPPYPEESTWPWLPPLLAADESNEPSPIGTCEGCQQTISEPSYLSVGTTPWHLHCLFCDVCGQNLQWEKTCYIHSGRVFCRQHYDSMLHCQRCGEKFNELDSIHRFSQGVCYHRSCLVCIICSRLLKSGDAFTVHNGNVYCVAHQFPEGAKQTLCWKYASPTNSATPMTTDVKPVVPSDDAWTRENNWKLSNDWIRLFTSPHSTSTPQKPDCLNIGDNGSKITTGLARLLTNSEEGLDPALCRQSSFQPDYHQTTPPLMTALYADRDTGRILSDVPNSRISPVGLDLSQSENQHFSPPFDRQMDYSSTSKATVPTTTTIHDIQMPPVQGPFSTRSSTGSMSREAKEANMRKHRNSVKQPMKHAKEILEKSKRIRTSFKHDQLNAMKIFFDRNQNPDSKDLKELSISTGLSKRVLQVWFQNARAKFRRAMLSPTHSTQTVRDISVPCTQEQQQQQVNTSLSSISDIFGGRLGSPSNRNSKDWLSNSFEQTRWNRHDVGRTKYQVETLKESSFFSAPAPRASHFPGFSAQESVVSSQNSALSTSFDSTSTPSPISQLFPMDELGDFCPFLFEHGTNE